MDAVIGSHRKGQEWQGLSRSASGRFPEFGLITIWLDLADINVSADRRTELAVRRTSKVWSGVAFPLYSFGMITVSMTWITPFDASMSAFTTLALSTLTPSVASIDT